MIDEERLIKFREFLATHWGDLSEQTFEHHAPKYIGDFDNFIALGELVVTAVLSHTEGGAELKPLGSLLIVSLKAAYDLGRESMLQ